MGGWQLKYTPKFVPKKNNLVTKELAHIYDCKYLLNRHCYLSYYGTMSTITFLKGSHSPERALVLTFLCEQKFPTTRGKLIAITNQILQRVKLHLP